MNDLQRWVILLNGWNAVAWRDRVRLERYAKILESLLDEQRTLLRRQEILRRKVDQWNCWELLRKKNKGEDSAANNTEEHPNVGGGGGGGGDIIHKNRQRPRGIHPPSYASQLHQECSLFEKDLEAFQRHRKHVAELRDTAGIIGENDEGNNYSWDPRWTLDANEFHESKRGRGMHHLFSFYHWNLQLFHWNQWATLYCLSLEQKILI